MTTQRRRKPPKPPPPAAIDWHFGDSKLPAGPFAEAFVRGIEQNAVARHLADAAPSDPENDKLKVAVDAARVRYVEQVQSLMDAAVQREQVREKAADRSSAMRSAAGDQTREHFKTAIDAVIAAGLAPTATTVFHKWPPHQWVPSRSRIAELLAERKAPPAPVEPASSPTVETAKPWSEWPGVEPEPDSPEVRLALESVRERTAWVLEQRARQPSEETDPLDGVSGNSG